MKNLPSDKAYVKDPLKQPNVLAQRNQILQPVKREPALQPLNREEAINRHLPCTRAGLASASLQWVGCSGAQFGPSHSGFAMQQGQLHAFCHLLPPIVQNTWMLVFPPVDC